MRQAQYMSVIPGDRLVYFDDERIIKIFKALVELALAAQLVCFLAPYCLSAPQRLKSAAQCSIFYRSNRLYVTKKFYYNKRAATI